MGKIFETGLGSFRPLNNSIFIDFGISLDQDICDIHGGLLDIALDVHGETGRFGNSQPEIEGNTTWDAAQADEQAPTVVDMIQRCVGVMGDTSLVCPDNDQGNEGSSYMVNASNYQRAAMEIETYQNYPNLGTQTRQSSSAHEYECSRIRKR
jgi:hypothetical protein